MISANRFTTNRTINYHFQANKPVVMFPDEGRQKVVVPKQKMVLRRRKYVFTNYMYSITLPATVKLIQMYIYVYILVHYSIVYRVKYGYMYLE